jgi:hypothetical protein
MNDRIDDVIAARLAAVANPTDDSDWLEVRRRARNLEARLTLRRRRRRLRHLRLAAAAAVVAGGVVALLGSLPAGDRPTRAGLGTRGVLGLHAVAAVAADAPSTTPAPGEYVYDETRWEYRGMTCTIEWWIAADRSGRMHQRGRLCDTPGDPGVKNSPPEGERPIKSGPWPSFGPRVVPLKDRWPSGDGLDIRFGPGEAPEVVQAITESGVNAWLDGLPTDPDALERALRRKLLKLRDSGGEVTLLGLMQVIGQLLSNPLASPALRSALYNIAGGLDGVEIKEQVRDPIGRLGAAIKASGYDQGFELIFDPATSAVLASVQLSRGRRFFTVYLKRRMVDSVNAHGGKARVHHRS